MSRSALVENVHPSLAVANLATGGSVGTAATTVDLYSTLFIGQTTAGQTLTIPNPTNTSNGRAISIYHKGTAAVTILGRSIAAGVGVELLWDPVALAWVISDVAVSAPAFAVLELSDPSNTYLLAAAEVFGNWKNASASSQTFTRYAVEVGVAPTGATLVLNFRVNGSNVASATATVAAAGTSVTGVLGANVVAATGDAVDVSVTSVGSTIPGGGNIIAVLATA